MYVDRKHFKLYIHHAQIWSLLFCTMLYLIKTKIQLLQTCNQSQTIDTMPTWKKVFKKNRMLPFLLYFRCIPIMKVSCWCISIRRMQRRHAVIWMNIEGDFFTWQLKPQLQCYSTITIFIFILHKEKGKNCFAHNKKNHLWLKAYPCSLMFK